MAVLFKKRAFVTVTILILISILLLLQMRLDRLKGESKKVEELELLPKPEIVKFMVIGYDQFAADILWLRIIQYVGEKAQTEKGWQWFIHTIGVITTLDPKFEYAYQFGGLILSVVASKPVESNNILKEGMKVNPDNWVFPFLIGFNYFDSLRDYNKAAQFISIAAKLPGSPFYLKQFATRLYATAGTPENGIIFLEQIIRSTTDETAKEKLEIRLKELVIERDIKILEKAVKRFEDIYGYAPQNLNLLVRMEIIRFLPKDPFSGYYYIDPGSKKVKSSSRTERLRVYEK